MPLYRVPVHVATEALVAVLMLASVGHAQQAVPSDPFPRRNLPSELLASPVWSRPLTILDYALFQMGSELKEQADLLESESSGLWTSTVTTRPVIYDRAYLDPTTGKVILGLDIAAHKFVESKEEICRLFIQTIVARVAAAGAAQREDDDVRNNVLSYHMPRSPYAVTTEAERDTAFEVLQRNTVLRVVLYESSSRSSAECERHALSDSIRVTRSIGQ